MVHPVSHASFVVRLEAFCCQIQPYRRQSVVPNWIRCAFEPYQRPSKERVTTPKGMHLPVEHRHVASDSGLSLEQSWNKGSFQKVPTHFLPRKTFLTSSCQIRHESHTCSDVWSNCDVECNGLAKNNSPKNTMRWPIIRYIYIYMQYT